MKEHLTTIDAFYDSTLANEPLMRYIKEKYKKTLDQLALRIKQDMIKKNPDLAEQFEKIDLKVDIDLILIQNRK